MIKSFATFARINRPSEYKDYLAEKKWTYSTHENKNRARQVIKAIIINGGKEYKFEDWSRDYEEYCENYYWQVVHDCVETY